MARSNLYPAWFHPEDNGLWRQNLLLKHRHLPLPHFLSSADANMHTAAHTKTYTHTSVNTPPGSSVNSSQPILSHTWLWWQSLAELQCWINLCSHHRSVFQRDRQSDRGRDWWIVAHCQNTVSTRPRISSFWRKGLLTWAGCQARGKTGLLPHTYHDLSPQDVEKGGGAWVCFCM